MLSCSAPRRIRNADVAIELKKYALGIELLTRDYESSDVKTEKAQLAYKLGDCYSAMSAYGSALKWCKKSYELGQDNKSLLAYAQALKKNEDYKEAQEAFTDLSNESIGGSIYRRDAQICKLAAEWKNISNNKFDYKINRLGFCESTNEFAAIYDPVGRLVFTADRLGSTGKRKYDWSGSFYSDLYRVESDNEIIGLEGGINTNDNEGTVSYSSDAKYIYFTRCSDLNVDNYYCQIYRRKLSGGEQSEELLDLGGGMSNTMHPALHATDTLLIFSSDRANGLGGFDLYKSVLKNGSWMTPVNLGKVINTTGNEKFPVWYNDTLYYSSDNLPGMGGLDIFKTWRINDSTWIPPQRLEYPVNSGADDFSFCVDTRFIGHDSVKMHAVFSSNRGYTNGDDIYEVFYIQKVKDVVKQPLKLFFVDLLFKSGREYGINTEHQLLDSVTIRDSSTAYINNTGKSNVIRIQVIEGDSLHFKAGRRGYLSEAFDIQIPFLGTVFSDTTIILKKEVILIPLILEKEFLLENVYYDFDKYNLRADAMPALNNLKKMLADNPFIKIKILSHTDCRGEEDYNLMLSQKRAESIVQFLIAAGISSDRLLAEGKGELSPVINCLCENCTEEEYQKNRRSTFKLIKY